MRGLLRVAGVAAVLAACGAVSATIDPTTVGTAGYPGAANPVPAPPYWVGTQSYNGALGGLWAGAANGNGNPVFLNIGLQNNAAPAATMTVEWQPWYNFDAEDPTVQLRDYLKVTLTNAFGVFIYTYDGPAVTSWNAAAGVWTGGDYPVAVGGGPPTATWRVSPNFGDVVWWVVDNVNLGG